jgi:hypothetical protein
LEHGLKEERQGAGSHSRMRTEWITRS